MMNDFRKSDGTIVPQKPSNKQDKHCAEMVEGRVTTEGNTIETPTYRTQSRESVSAGLDRVREKAEEDKEVQFSSLLHHISPELLERSFYALNRNAASGVDRMTWAIYKETLRQSLKELHQAVHSGSYRAMPARRIYIPKQDGRQRPLGIKALEDKIVEQAVVTVLNQIYEPMFLGFSYGFREGRNPHQALDALNVAITDGKVNWILDADIRSFFDTLSHENLLMFLRHRIADRRILRLIRKWIRVGYVEKGKRVKQTIGVAQGSVISPLLSNVYLHYVLDLWAHQWRKRHARGKVYIIRYADDFVVCFQYRDDAQRFSEALHERMRKFSLELHSEKTRLIEFGRYAQENRRKRGEGKPETFNFLGFTHICSRSRKGGFLLKRRSIAKRFRQKIAQVKEELRIHMHANVKDVGKWLRSIIIGYQNYHAVPTNLETVKRFKDCIVKEWIKTLRRRSQKGRNLTWERYRKLVDWLIPKVHLAHPFPSERFYATHPR